MPGKLYIVSTPIGNLKDITFRAIEVLKSVNLIACEDTRHTKKLLIHYNITVPTTSYFEYNKIKKGEYILRLLKEGKDVALVSDSGTPGISDPGFSIIRSAIENNIPVTVIPGPTAFVAGLVMSGMPANEFLFRGFLPQKPGHRRNELELLSKEKRTIILYESPHRLLKVLNDILDIMGNRQIAITREITKVFEEAIRVNVQDAISHFTQKPPKGEFVIIISANS